MAYIRCGYLTTNKMNLFVQTAEPKTKEGIWIKADKTYKNALVDPVPYLANNFVNSDTYFPNYANVKGDMIPKFNNNDNKIYYAYHYSSDSYYMQLCTYDINTKTTTLSGAVSRSARVSWVIVGDYLYGFNIYSDSSSNSVYTTAVRYPLNNVSNSAAVTVADIGTLSTSYGLTTYAYHYYNGYIYLFGNNGYDFRVFKYNISANTWSVTNLDIPSVAGSGGYYTTFKTAVGVSNNIYIFGFSNSNTSTYSNAIIRYDLNTNALTKVGVTPFDIKNAAYLSACAVGTDIYLYNNYYSSTNSDYAAYAGVHKYDTLTNTLTKICAPYNNATYVYRFACLWQDKIFFNPTAGVFSFTSKSYTDLSVVIQRTNEQVGRYNTQIFGEAAEGSGYTRFLSGFDDAWLYHNNNLDQTLPTYYGNGTSWVKIKN